MKISNIGRVRAAAATTALLLLCFISAGCGSGGSKSSPGGASALSASASRGQGKVAFTIHWPQAAPQTRLLPTASKAIKFTVVEYDAPNNVVVLTKIAPRPADSETTTTVLLDGLPTVLVNILAEAVPNADGTGVVQASALLQVSVEQNKTLDKTITLDSTVKTVEVTGAPVTIGADGKFQLNLSDQTTGGNIKEALTATAYNAAHEIVLTALDKWVFKSAKPDVATVAPTGGTRAEGITGAMATVTATGAGSSTVTVTESESQVSKELTASVIGSRPSFWNQTYGDAQNSSCSSAPSASGVVAASFAPVAEGSGTSLYDVSPYQSVEDTNGNLAFNANASSDNAKGIYIYSKSGDKKSHLGGGNGAPEGPTYGADSTLYTIEHNEGLTGSAHVVAQGAKSWDFAANGPIVSYLTLSGDNATLYMDVAGNLTALNAATGQKLWQAPTSTSRYASGQYALKPAVSLDNATVYARTSTGVAAFDAATGSKQWENAGGSDLSYYVGVGPTGIVYADINEGFLSPNYSFRAIDPATGRTLWSQDKFGGNFVLSRTGTVYGTIGLSKVQALNGATGAVLWTKGTGLDDSGHGTMYITQAGAGDGTVYVSKLDAFSSYYSVRSIAALNTADGSAKWILAPNIYSRPVDGVTETRGSYTVQFVGGDGTVYGSNAAANALGTPRTLDAIR